MEVTRGQLKGIGLIVECAWVQLHSWADWVETSRSGSVLTLDTAVFYQKRLPGHTQCWVCSTDVQRPGANQKPNTQSERRRVQPETVTGQRGECQYWLRIESHSAVARPPRGSQVKVKTLHQIQGSISNQHTTLYLSSEQRSSLICSSVRR